MQLNEIKMNKRATLYRRSQTRIHWEPWMLNDSFGDRDVLGRILKGKAVPSQAWSGPEGSRKLRFTDFMKTAQDGSKVVSLTHRPPLPQKMLLVLISVRG